MFSIILLRLKIPLLFLVNCRDFSSYHEELLNFVKIFFFPLLMQSCIFVLYSTGIVYCINWLSHIQPILQHWEVTQPWCKILSFCILLVSICQYFSFFEDFYISIHRRYWTMGFFFLVISSSSFEVRIILASEW